jgi:polyisoprenoid-binding protein YceI
VAKSSAWAVVAFAVLGTCATAWAQGGDTRIELQQGTKARYRVGERLVGIDFNNDAVGETTNVTGAIVLKADGSVDSAQSKVVVDMKSLASDQALRDMFLQLQVLQTSKFPTLEFVPTKITGLPWPLPVGNKVPNSTIVMPVPAGFQIAGNLTLRGVTRPVTWSVASTIDQNTVSGRGTATITFADFGITKPVVPVLASVEDSIKLELEFRAKRTGQ